MQVLIVGAHGATGQLALEKSIGRGHQVTGMVRTADQAAAIGSLGATPVEADLEREETLPAAVANQDAVIFTAGSKGKRLDTVDKGGAISLIKVAGQSRVRRFVMLSSFYAGNPEAGPEKIPAFLWAKHEADRYLEASTLDYTIIRPGWLTNAAETGHITVARYFDNPDGSISRADVAETLVTALEVPETIRQTFEIISGSTPIRDALESVPQLTSAGCMDT
jgi:uncharacterized protein YbjT (DUF2867 family)